MDGINRWYAEVILLVYFILKKGLKQGVQSTRVWHFNGNSMHMSGSRGRVRRFGRSKSLLFSFPFLLEIECGPTGIKIFVFSPIKASFKIRTVYNYYV